MAMRERESRGSGLQVCGLLGILMLTSLTGCGWLFGDSTPSEAAKVRPGAERQVAPSNALQSAGAGRQYDAAVTPVDETRTGPKIGSIVPDKGGQKAQLDAAAKEAAERDKQAREEREKAAANAAERKAKEAATGAKGADAKGADAKGVITTPPADQPPTQPAAPPPAPITATPVPPPPAAPSADQKS
jgi:hypothetical protein